jgi:hypothetical protein
MNSTMADDTLEGEHIDEVELTEITHMDNTKDNKSEKDLVLEKERDEAKKDEKKDEGKEKKSDGEEEDKATEKTTMLGGDEKEKKYPE